MDPFLFHSPDARQRESSDTEALSSSERKKSEDSFFFFVHRQGQRDSYRTRPVPLFLWRKKGIFFFLFPPLRSAEHGLATGPSSPLSLFFDFQQKGKGVGRQGFSLPFPSYLGNGEKADDCPPLSLSLLFSSYRGKLAPLEEEHRFLLSL